MTLQDGQWASEEAVSETATALRSQGHAVTLLPCGEDLTFNEDWFFERRVEQWDGQEAEGAGGREERGYSRGR